MELLEDCVLLEVKHLGQYWAHRMYLKMLVGIANTTTTITATITQFETSLQMSLMCLKVRIYLMQLYAW